MPNKKIRVLVVDDSALMREMISSILASDPSIEVLGSAPDPLVAREKIKALNPDVVTLDIEMPKMDGIEFLRRLMSLRPTRVLMISTLTASNTEATLRALELGAIDCLEKPLSTSEHARAQFREAVLSKVHLVASASLNRALVGTEQITLLQRATGAPTDGLIAIGASTGGVEALSAVLRKLPPGLPPIAVVLHMPAKFTGSFAKRLDGLCQPTVVEASDGLALKSGHVVLAAGGLHLEILRKPGSFRCHVYPGPMVSGHVPSVDVLFESVAVAAGPAGIGVILTGMGQDGAQGLLAMRRAGARTFGQNEQSSLVYGMPKVAAELGAVEMQLSLDQIAGAIVAAAERPRAIARQA
ncbi:CheB Chemotaxis response regulator containing a CheY-like receiver domain and a methylesterase domain [Rhabdaerophilaceae bacterium]